MPCGLFIERQAQVQAITVKTTFINYETTNHREQLHPLVTRKVRDLNVREEMLKTKRETN